MLDAPITITTRELLSVSPDIRRHIKEQLTAKRVGTTAFVETTDQENVHQMLLASLAAENLIVARDIEELRAVDVIIEGCEVEATIDDGSQILSIREDVWQKSGLPLRADKTIVMESANLTQDKTLGLIKDLKLIIGGYDFYVQAQVVREAPYEVLLGRPFFTLTQASHQHYSNRDSRLRVLDPNTQELITIPTRPRKRNKITQGF
ncbi:hypothetical protein BYT27DRAFT_7116368 [Phlegmacium glaucopus]|nr:hypothetical protein BYT27DRAFT_7116368 [Phlegmacium glaucopus]